MGVRRDAKKQIRLEQEIARRRVKIEEHAAAERSKTTARAQKNAEAKAKWDAMSPQERRVVMGVFLVIVGGFIAVVVLFGNDGKTTPKASATSSTDAGRDVGAITAAATSDKASACDDFKAISQGISDGTMRVADVVVALGLMAEKTRNLAQVDPSFAAWDTAVRRLQTDFQENNAEAVRSDTPEVAFECA